RKYFMVLVMIFLGLVLKVSYGYNQYKMNSVPLMAAQHIPGFFGFTMRGTLKKLGIEAPSRDEVRIKSEIDANDLLNYPAAKIERDLSKKKYNVVWLACESWRWDMLDAEIMPAASAFAKKSTNFKDHYSGGNGTRQGMFSMFYGIYGNYWDVIMKNRQSPVLMDWMIEDGYNFNCQTSAKFSYPEFDQTIFSRISSDNLYSYDKGLTWQRDQHNTKKFINYLKSVDRSKPFMSFMFFESTHAPYEFPQDAVIRENHAPAINYATVKESDGPRIKDRYINSSHHLDMRLGEIFKTLEEEQLLEDTIVVLVGDHGEEFFEKGRLGHNSTFVQEQIRTPLVIYFPDRDAEVYEQMSSHLDIVPMLAPYFGVRNAASDFSIGYNLLDGKSKRDHAILADWSKVFFVGEKYKTYLPSSSAGYAMQELRDLDDRKLPSVDVFYKENKRLLFNIQRNMSKFMH
ncbi:MAG: sulfatase-like hydrolase/transferase, partial [Lentisphaeria bacterium]